MALSQKLELRHSQSLVMTPQLMQAIKLLQLSNLDLLAYVEAELERNPLLERDETDNAIGDLPDGADDAGPAVEAEGGEEWLTMELEVSPEAIADKLDTTLSNVFPDDHGAAPGESAPAPAADNWNMAPSSRPVSAEDYNLEAFVADEKSLGDHLTDQLGLATDDPTLRLIGHALIDELDEAGYMRADMAALAERLGAPIALVEDVLAIVQGFEPNGIGARDLAECLSIQLKERNRLDPAMATLVSRLDLVAARDHQSLKRLCGVDDEDLAEMLAELRLLNPKPGASFGGGHVQPVIPDVLVRPGPDGAWQIELNSETLPRVLVNQNYFASVSRRTKAKSEEKTYIADCLQTANWLVKALDQRAKTILKVSAEIVRQQDGFLVHGVQHLRPLNLKAVAEAIGMHESTVSRVTANKYMSTPRGTLELKYFFTASIASTGGEDAFSAEAVRHRIKQMIEAERPRSVLSDDAIVKALRTSGIDIARRTVAKYREAMRIPSSVQRRREKLA